MVLNVSLVLLCTRAYCITRLVASAQLGKNVRWGNPPPPKKKTEGFLNIFVYWDRGFKCVYTRAYCITRLVASTQLGKNVR